MDSGAQSYWRFLNGDDQGIVEIVGSYKDGLILYLNSLVNNVYTAEELTEETFFRLMIKKPSFRGRSSFKSWLYSIGRNIAIDYIRHNSRQISTPMEDMDLYLSEKAELEKPYLKEELRKTIIKALDNLPTDYRQIIWLIYFEEFSNEEAAVTMKKSSRQITNLLYRAKQYLKTELEKEGFTYEEY